MDTKNLTTFIYVAELRSFTKAADRLGFSSLPFPFRSNRWKTNLAVSFLNGSIIRSSLQKKAGKCWNTPTGSAR